MQPRIIRRVLPGLFVSTTTFDLVDWENTMIVFGVVLASDEIADD
jgi:hypothetical protein